MNSVVKMQRERGFTSHALMGATFLAGVWFAVYLPDLLAAIRVGGWLAMLAYAAGAVGVVLGPLVIVLVPGDEGFGFVGLAVALLVGWLSAKVAGAIGAATETVQAARLVGAALAPLLLFGLFAWLAKRAERRDQA